MDLRETNCPMCKSPVIDVTHRPFCSARCKLVDLANWLNEAYRISSPLTSGDGGGSSSLH